MKRPAKERLDQALVARGLAPSRAKAQAYCLAGEVRVNEARETSPAARVGETDVLTVLPARRWASRGGEKLDGAVTALGVSIDGRIALDAGASTGGFVDVLLARGAARVHAVDVGRGLLDARLARDPRVVVHDETNLRNLRRAEFFGDRGEPVDLATLDLSFISLTKVREALDDLLRAGGEVLAMVKPQFEVGRARVGKGGIVRDPEDRAEAARSVAAFYRAAGYDLLGFAPSGAAGRKGNREAFVHLRRREDGKEGEARVEIVPW